MPSVVPSSAVIGAPVRRRIFISYSHDDLEKFARPFLKHLKVLIRGRRDLGFQEEDIFFDREGILAGYAWNETIGTALEESRVVLFLLSVDSLNSEYCLKRELGHAFQAGDAVRKIIVYLRPVGAWEHETAPGDPQGRCLGDWKRQSAPGDREGRKLGDFQAVPLHDEGRGDLRPIALWDEPDSAWKATIEQIASAMSERVQTPDRPVNPKGSPLPPLTAYRCNQKATVRDFTSRLEEWKESGRALAVLLRGQLEDHLPQFWARLREMELKDFLPQSLKANSYPLRPVPASYSNSTPGTKPRGIRLKERL